MRIGGNTFFTEIASQNDLDSFMTTSFKGMLKHPPADPSLIRNIIDALENPSVFQPHFVSKEFREKASNLTLASEPILKALRELITGLLDDKFSDKNTEYYYHLLKRSAALKQVFAEVMTEREFYILAPATNNPNAQSHVLISTGQEQQTTLWLGASPRPLNEDTIKSGMGDDYEKTLINELSQLNGQTHVWMNDLKPDNAEEIIALYEKLRLSHDLTATAQPAVPEFA